MSDNTQDGWSTDRRTLMKASGLAAGAGAVGVVSGSVTDDDGWTDISFTGTFDERPIVLTQVDLDRGPGVHTTDERRSVRSGVTPPMP